MSERLAGSCGILLAAGRGRRMGTMKQVLPLRGGSTTVIASAFDVIAPHTDAMVVVIGAEAEIVMNALARRTFMAVESDADAEMLDSICAGLRAALLAEQRFDAMWIHPGDHPGVALATVQRLISAFEADRAKAVMPEYHGKGGHPVIVPRAVAQRIVEWSEQSRDGGSGGVVCSGGLRQFWINHPKTRQRVEVDDPLCVVDLDTPEQYAIWLNAPGNV